MSRDGRAPGDRWFSTRIVRPTILVLLAGCAGDHHDKQVETAGATVVEREHEHHGHHATCDDGGSDNIGQDILDDAASGLISGFFQAIIDAIFHRDD